jgi:hypothetical protein
MRTALPIDVSLPDQPQIGFVHQRGRLEGVALPVMAKMACGALAEFGVHEGQQRVLRVRIPG